MPVIPAPGKLRQEDVEFKANLGYVTRPCQTKTKRKCLTCTASWETLDEFCDHKPETDFTFLVQHNLKNTGA
jgi:hypothetical protein